MAVYTISPVGQTPQFQVNVIPDIEIGASISVEGVDLVVGTYEVLNDTGKNRFINVYVDGIVGDYSYRVRYKNYGSPAFFDSYSQQEPIQLDSIIFNDPTLGAFGVPYMAPGIYYDYYDNFTFTIGSAFNGIVTDFGASPDVKSFDGFVTSTINTVQSKNANVSAKFKLTGNAPFSIQTNTNLYTGLTQGPFEQYPGSTSTWYTVQFESQRYSSTPADRIVTFIDSLSNESEYTLDNVQRIDSDSYYTSYTFTNDGILTMSPSFPGDIDLYTNPWYQVFDIQTNLSLSSKQTTPTFTNLPLKDVWVKITDDFGGTHTYTVNYIPTLSLTNVAELEALSFTNDPMVVVWDSGIKNSENMKYKFTLLDKNDEEIIKTSVYPDIENAFYGIYNMNLIYNNYVTKAINPFNADLVITDDVYKFSYNVNDQIEGVGVTSPYHYCVKAATTYGNKVDIDDYIGEASSTSKFLTSWDGDYLLRTDDWASINFLNGTFSETDVNNQITHIQFNKNDESVATFIPVGVNTTLYQNVLLNIGFGPSNYTKAFDTSNVFDINDVVISSNFMSEVDTESYSIRLVNKAGVNLTNYSEKLVVELNTDEMCLAHEPTMFLFMDKLGNFNTFTFNGINIKEYDIERDVINNDYHKLIGDKWTYNIGDRGRKNVNISMLEAHSATSGWLNDTLSSNLIDLYASSDVYIIKDLDLYPVVITTNGVEEKNIKNNRLFNHTITYQMAYDINTNS